MPAKTRTNPIKGCLIISPIADQSTPERAKIHQRAKFLEKQIALALKPLGYVAELITSDTNKHWITPRMIQRLTSDPLTIAVLDGANPNCTYEVGIRHAFCLPMICLIEQHSAGPRLPFNIHDVDPLQYPPVPSSGKWGEAAQKRFQKALQARARSAPGDSPLESFSIALQKASARSFLRLIFIQKQAEFESLKQELDVYRTFLRKDYEVNQSIRSSAAQRLFNMLNASHTRAFERNSVLHALAQREEVLAIGEITASCATVCDQIAETTGQIADVARRLKNSIPVKKRQSTSSLPTRGKVDRQLKSILRSLGLLHNKIAALLNQGRL